MTSRYINDAAGIPTSQSHTSTGFPAAAHPQLQRRLLIQSTLTPSVHSRWRDARCVAFHSEGHPGAVSCVPTPGLLTLACPMGVATPLLSAVAESEDPAALMAANSITIGGAVLSAGDVAAAALDGVRNDTFMVLPHPKVLDMRQGKGADYDRWISGMRRYRLALHADGRVSRYVRCLRGSSAR